MNSAALKRLLSGVLEGRRRYIIWATRALNARPVSGRPEQSRVLGMLTTGAGTALSGNANSPADGTYMAAATCLNAASLGRQTAFRKAASPVSSGRYKQRTGSAYRCAAKARLKNGSFSHPVASWGVSRDLDREIRAVGAVKTTTSVFCDNDRRKCLH